MNHKRLRLVFCITFPFKRQINWMMLMILGVDGTLIIHRLQVIMLLAKFSFPFTNCLIILGVTSSMYVDERDPSYPEIECPDDQAGLYIKNQDNKVFKVSIPKDNLAFQLGAAMQLASADNLRATHHMVKGISSNTKSDVP